MTQPNPNGTSHFCTLGYRPNGIVLAASEDASIIAIATLNEDSQLTVAVAPDWRAFVEHEDAKYIQSLLEDISERSKLSPEALFEQLSSLNVGPLVTQETGTGLLDQVPLVDMLSRFSRL